MSQNSPGLEFQAVLQRLTAWEEHIKALRQENRDRAQRTDKLFDELFRRINELNTELAVIKVTATQQTSLLVTNAECASIRAKRDEDREKEWIAHAQEREQEAAKLSDRENKQIAKISTAAVIVAVPAWEFLKWFGGLILRLVQSTGGNGGQ